MKNIRYILLATLFFTIFGCSEFTDVQPKGKNLLSTVDELEMLLNAPYEMDYFDGRMMSGDFIRSFDNVPTLLSNPNRTRSAIMISWDDSNIDKMAELTPSDSEYVDYYGVIGQRANPVLMQIDNAKGSEAVKNHLKAEALTLRAYFHYLLVNKFAKAYNPATAASDPGIPYVKEDWDLTMPTEKISVQEVYDNIMIDIEAAIELNALPVTALNKMRICKAAAYAVKALTQISMQQFDEAAVTAQSALDITGTVNDYNEMLTTVTGSILGDTYPAVLREPLQCEEDLFFVHNVEFYTAITPEGWGRFEDGHASRDHMTSDKHLYDFVPGQGLGTGTIGLDYTFTYDLESGWNPAGLKTTQMYLIIAENEIRKQNWDDAMDALDAIRVNRIDPTVYAPLKGSVNNKADAILHLKQTSHGENFYTIHNFYSKKRWNQLEDYKETFVKNIEGVEYTLTPDSPLWIFPFPVNATSTNGNLLPQNYLAQ